ncbi:MAG: hypothetical protein PHV39_07815 [Methanomicrobium sp.]|nr:hypothetical protein [Methanomicrobium sp.]
MSNYNWEIKLAALLLMLTILIYSLKYFFLQNTGDTINYIFNSLGFLPVNVLLVTIVLNKLLILRARHEKLEKMNMVIGAFFTEVGSHLITVITKIDPDYKDISDLLLIKKDIKDDNFKNIKEKIASYNTSLNTGNIDIISLNNFLISKRDFMLRMLENPVLLEHESFTELLRAVFHLAEELKCRGDFSCLPDTDYAHLSGDINRVYKTLVLEWLDYMNYLKNNYPYLFSLEMRMNPFDKNASPIVNQY